MKKQKGKEYIEKLIPDKEVRQGIMRGLYDGKSLLGKEGLFTDLLQGFVNAALEGEMDEHLLDSKDSGIKNRRNGHTKKQLKSDLGTVSIRTPRDRAGEFEPELVKKRSRRLTSGIDSIILSLYARGHSVEDVRRHIEEIYGIEMSSGAISAITQKVWQEVLDWQQRPLDECYVLIYLDAIHYKVRQDNHIRVKAIYSVYAVDVEGKRDILGLYLGESEGANKWGLILEDLKRRGVQDVLFFSIDGLSGFKQAIEYVFPQSIVQRCIVHMLRDSTRFVNYKDREKIYRDLRKVYKAANEEQAMQAFELFKQKWYKKYPRVIKKWQDNWCDLMVYMNYTDRLRTMLYTTNPVEALHRIMRKTTKAKGAWSTDNGLIKQLYLSLMYNKKSWNGQVMHWNPVRREIIDKFGQRFTKWLVD